MKTSTAISLALCFILAYAFNGEICHASPPVKSRLIVAFQDNHPTTGNDRDTILFPNPDMNTVQTRDTGTETFSKDSPLPEIHTPPPPEDEMLHPPVNDNNQ